MKHTRSIVAACVLAAASLAVTAPASAQGQPEGKPPAQPAPAEPAPAPAPVPTETAPAPAATPAATAAPAPVPPPPPLPDADLLKLSQLMREGPLGREPNAVAYLDLIVAGKASAAQVNDFAAYVAKKGMVKIAIEYQEYATKLGPAEPVLWLNLGSMNRTIGNLGPAESAFKKALAINPNHALAHYNLGAVYDADKKYDEAIEEYRRALVLDPELADPRKNPQVVNNEYLLAVKLTIYENQSGSLGLPLLQMQKPPAPPAPAVPPKNAAPEKK
jgi:Tetratricopeptide repeat